MRLLLLVVPYMKNTLIKTYIFFKFLKLGALENTTHYLQNSAIRRQFS
jgi:ABC-type spermidine/putrescine transport system permease subunit I